MEKIESNTPTPENKETKKKNEPKAKASKDEIEAVIEIEVEAEELESEEGIVEESEELEEDIEIEEDGGYACIVENDNDVQELKRLYDIDIDTLTEEYGEYISDDWITIIFLFNNEFGVTLIAPAQLTAISRFKDSIEF